MSASAAGREVLLRLSGIRLFAKHGAEEFEAERGGGFEIEIEVAYPEPEPATRDSAMGRPDYARLHQMAVEIFARKRFNYIEPLAAAIAEGLLAADAIVTRVRVAVVKLRPPVGGPIDSVRAEVERRR